MTPTPPTLVLPTSAHPTPVLPIQASPAQEPPVQVPPTQASPTQVPPAQVFLVQVLSTLGTSIPGTSTLATSTSGTSTFNTSILITSIFKVVTPKEFVTPDKAVTTEEIPSSTQVLNSYFDDEIKNPGTHKAYEKSRLVLQAGNDKDKKLELTQSPIIQAYDFDQDFHIWPPPEQISLLGVSRDCIVKVMKPIHDVPEASTISFAVYHPHDKELRMINAAYDPYLRYSSDKLRTIASVYHPKAFFDPFHTTQTEQFLPDDQALSNKRLQWQITDKSRGLYYVKLDPQDTDLLSQFSYVICLADTTNKANTMHSYKQMTCSVLAVELYTMAHRFDIEKRHWGRYQIVRTKSNQHEHYGIDELGKYGTGKNRHLTTLERVASVGIMCWQCDGNMMRM